MSIEDRVALVTGGTSGIGAATARALAAQGARVFVASRSAPKDSSLKLTNAQFLARDVTDERAVADLVEQVQIRAGQLDLAVNAAGIEGELLPLADYPFDECQRVFDVNVIGTFLSIKYELSAMRTAGGGAIVNLASIAATKGIPNAAVYAASKCAVIGLTKSAALEAADVPVRVNAVCPSLVDTAMADRLADKSGVTKSDFAAANPMQRVASPDEVAATICCLLCDDATSFVSGQAIGIDGAQSAK